MLFILLSIGATRLALDYLDSAESDSYSTSELELSSTSTLRSEFGACSSIFIRKTRTRTVRVLSVGVVFLDRRNLIGRPIDSLPLIV
jgi:hypothetical protein